MISVIVYGRNDSYGYNLHKRVALSLNNLASLLSEATDEILFVDYGTPRGFPTLPEAIADTLTDAVWRKLKIFRFSEAQHNSLGIRTHLKVLEPHARNIALRRSLPTNRWVLSTNTDMIFVPLNDKSLTENVADLEDGHYGLPRFELPEGLWESLNRYNPEETISQVARWGEDYSLNSVALSWEPHRFDAPGDFQLMLREDLWRVDGFDERMTLGWHVDSNISRRLSFLRGPVKDLSSRLLGYHCDHTRQETPMHKAGAPQNSTLKFIDLVAQPGLRFQRESWGAPKETIAGFSLEASTSSRLIEALPKSISKHPELDRPRRYNASGFDNDPPPNQTVLTFLLDLFISEPIPPSISWIGFNAISAGELQGCLLNAAGVATFTGFWNPTFLGKQDFEPIMTSDYIILDFRPLEDCDSDVNARNHEEQRRVMMSTLRKLWSQHRGRTKNNYAPKVVGIDVVNTSVDSEFHTFVTAAKTPYVVGFRHGYLVSARDIGISRILRQNVSRFKSRIRRRFFGDDNVASAVARITGLKFARKILNP